MYVQDISTSTVCFSLPYQGVPLYVNTLCVCAQANINALRMWVCGLHHQLGQFLFLCLINGSPVVPLCSELRSVCSCSFCICCTACTHKQYFPLTAKHPLNRCTGLCRKTTLTVINLCGGLALVKTSQKMKETENNGSSLNLTSNRKLSCLLTLFPKDA